MNGREEGKNWEYFPCESRRLSETMSRVIKLLGEPKTFIVQLGQGHGELEGNLFEEGGKKIMDKKPLDECYEFI